MRGYSAIMAYKYAKLLMIAFIICGALYYHASTTPVIISSQVISDEKSVKFENQEHNVLKEKAEVNEAEEDNEEITYDSTRKINEIIPIKNYKDKGDESMKGYFNYTLSGLRTNYYERKESAEDILRKEKNELLMKKVRDIHSEKKKRKEEKRKEVEKKKQEIKDRKKERAEMWQKKKEDIERIKKEKKEKWAKKKEEVDAKKKAAEEKRQKMAKRKEEIEEKKRNLEEKRLAMKEKKINIENIKKARENKLKHWKNFGNKTKNHIQSKFWPPYLEPSDAAFLKSLDLSSYTNEVSLSYLHSK